MKTPRGRWVALSAARAQMCDLMRACRNVPLVTAERLMDVAELGELRAATRPKLSWAALFLSAYARVCAAEPILRRMYLPYPWPHFYESAEVAATMAVERFIDGEAVVLFGLIKRPERRALPDLTDEIRRFMEAPVEEVDCFRRAARIARLPWPLRRAALWLALNFFGRQRVKHFGTFGFTATGTLGIGSLRPLAPLTTTLHTGLFDERGRVMIRLTFDHRVVDGGPIGRALLGMEEQLRGPVCAEVRGLRAAAA
jgi:hypothetical protein